MKSQQLSSVIPALKGIQERSEKPQWFIKTNTNVYNTYFTLTPTNFHQEELQPLDNSWLLPPQKSKATSEYGKWKNLKHLPVAVFRNYLELHSFSSSLTHERKIKAKKKLQSCNLFKEEAWGFFLFWLQSAWIFLSMELFNNAELPIISVNFLLS